MREALHPTRALPLPPAARLPSPSPEWQRGKRLPKSRHPAEPGHGARAYPSAAGPAGAWSRCPAAWPPSCGAGCLPGWGGPGQDGRRSAAGDGNGGWHRACRSHGRGARGHMMPGSPRQPYLGRGAAPQHGEVELRGRGGPALHPRGEGTSVALCFGTIDLGTETGR